ncbi:redoxin domain-containing protein [Gemmatimonas groenlandica]|uniref:TlpA family protein disulfide reductase n=1 Tax=Gemmatimonas groenlandica TaxID=2732249 RepID=A0A6M4ISQ0_9BACT|nr:redoxin domain-containing protein [Gemmatimonas groenlandica]QJR36496.1 TlpA family protein disulfide reductase [Gemmatimonas groenlandica]
MTTPSNLHVAHPSMATWQDYLSAPVAQRDRALTDHRQRCAECKHTVQFLTTLDERARRLPLEAAPTALRARILASRAAGVRVLVPEHVDAFGDDDVSSDVPTVAAQVTRRSRWRIPTTIAAGVAAWSAIALFRGTPVVEAGMISGTMTLSTTLPKAGEVVTVRYNAGALLGRPAELRLRARIRTVHGESYNVSVPVVEIATLHRTTGKEYVGRFTLPDSVVFAALAVEDTAALAVDDLGGRAWEVMRAGANGAPLLSALDQRNHDLMGRGWEEGLATTRRMMQLYPDSIGAWTWLQSFESWMSLETDSTRAAHKRASARFDARHRAMRDISPALIGTTFWYTRRTDSVANAYWHERLLREAPTQSFAAQDRMLTIAARELPTRRDTTTALAGLEALWPDVPADRAPQIVSAALRLLPPATANADDLLRWSDRLVAADSSPATARYVAVRLLAAPAWRDEGKRRLRAEITRLASARAQLRALDESRTEQVERLARSQRLALAQLGRALADDGAHRAALDTLALATAAGWDLSVFNTVRETSLKVGDSTTARIMAARVSVDPSTAPSRRAALQSAGVTQIGAAAWAELVRSAQRDLSTRVMAGAKRRVLPDVTLRALDGSSATLRSLLAPQVTVVVFWSTDCGPAVDALGEIQRTATALAKRGIRAMTVVEQAQSTPALQSVLRTKSFTLPVYLDVGGSAGKAFNNWGTPQAYLLDAKGNVMFSATSDFESVALRAEAMVLAAEAGR